MRPTGHGLGTDTREHEFFHRQDFEGSNYLTYIGKHELKVLQELAKELLAFQDRQLEIALSAGEIEEIINGNDKA